MQQVCNCLQDNSECLGSAFPSPRLAECREYTLMWARIYLNKHICVNLLPSIMSFQGENTISFHETKSCCLRDKDSFQITFHNSVCSRLSLTMRSLVGTIFVSVACGLSPLGSNYLFSFQNKWVSKRQDQCHRAENAQLMGYEQGN